MRSSQTYNLPAYTFTDCDKKDFNEVVQIRFWDETGDEQTGAVVDHIGLTYDLESASFTVNVSNYGTAPMDQLYTIHFIHTLTYA